jgi:hypothetical protein
VCPAVCASPFARSAAWRLNMIRQTGPRVVILTLPNPMPALPVGSVPISARSQRSACSPIKRFEQGTIIRTDLRLALGKYLPPLSGDQAEHGKKWFIIKPNFYYNSHIIAQAERCLAQSPSTLKDTCSNKCLEEHIE